MKQEPKEIKLNDKWIPYVGSDARYDSAWGEAEDEAAEIFMKSWEEQGKKEAAAVAEIAKIRGEIGRRHLSIRQQTRGNSSQLAKEVRRELERIAVLEADAFGITKDSGEPDMLEHLRKTYIIRNELNNLHERIIAEKKLIREKKQAKSEIDTAKDDFKSETAAAAAAAEQQLTSGTETATAELAEVQAVAGEVNTAADEAAKTSINEIQEVAGSEEAPVVESGVQVGLNDAEAVPEIVAAKVNVEATANETIKNPIAELDRQIDEIRTELSGRLNKNLRIRRQNTLKKLEAQRAKLSAGQDAAEETSGVEIVPDASHSAARTVIVEKPTEVEDEVLETIDEQEIFQLSDEELSGLIQKELSSSDAESPRLARELKDEVLRIESLPPKEQKGLLNGLANLGFRSQELKGKAMNSILKKVAADFVDQDSTLARFFVGLKSTYENDAIRAKKSREKENKGAMLKAGGIGALTGNLFKFGRIAYDFNFANPFRYVTGIAMAAGRTAEAAKEARLSNKKLIEKNRIVDIDRAAEEAWAIHKKAKAATGGEIKTADFEEAYRDGLPKDLLARLSRLNDSGVGVLEKVALKHLSWAVKRIDSALDEIDKNKKYTSAQKKSLKQNILLRKEQQLKDLDRLIGDQGMVDTLAYAGLAAEKASKATANVMIIDSVHRLIKHLPQLAAWAENFAETQAPGAQGKVSGFFSSLYDKYATERPLKTPLAAPITTDAVPVPMMEKAAVEFPAGESYKYGEASGDHPLPPADDADAAASPDTDQTVQNEGAGAGSEEHPGSESAEAAADSETGSDGQTDTENGGAASDPETATEEPPVKDDGEAAPDPDAESVRPETGLTPEDADSGKEQAALIDDIDQAQTPSGEQTLSQEPSFGGEANKTEFISIVDTPDKLEFVKGHENLFDYKKPETFKIFFSACKELGLDFHDQKYIETFQNMPAEIKGDEVRGTGYLKIFNSQDGTQLNEGIRQLLGLSADSKATWDAFQPGASNKTAAIENFTVDGKNKFQILISQDKIGVQRPRGLLGLKWDWLRGEGGIKAGKPTFDLNLKNITKVNETVFDIEQMQKQGEEQLSRVGMIYDDNGRLIDHTAAAGEGIKAPAEAENYSNMIVEETIDENGRIVSAEAGNGQIEHPAENVKAESQTIDHAGHKLADKFAALEDDMGGFDGRATNERSLGLVGLVQYNNYSPKQVSEYLAEKYGSGHIIDSQINKISRVLEEIKSNESSAGSARMRIEMALNILERTKKQ